MKHLIVDAEKLKVWKDYYDKQHNIEAVALLESLKLDGAILSEEESLKKFKEIWEDGLDYECRLTKGAKESSWERIKDTL